MFELAPQEGKNVYGASIKVLGVGGAGGNAVNSMIEAGLPGIEFIVANTDAQALNQSKSSTKIQLGEKLTKGLGSGAHPDIGRRAAQEDIEHIIKEIGDADIVFLTAGMGGGTGSGALPVIARSLKERGILSIAIVTRPFLFEGKHRSRVAQEAIDLLSNEVDTLVVVSNQKLLETVDRSVSMINAFDIINKMLYQSVKSIADIIINPGHINVDFADIKSIMKDMGIAVIGTGRGTGTDRAAEAALQAIASPLLENISIEGAHSVLLNITGGLDLGLHEIHEAAALIQEQAAPHANIIIGSVIDPQLIDEMIVTVIATGFEPVQIPHVNVTKALDNQTTEDILKADNQNNAKVIEEAIKLNQKSEQVIAVVSLPKETLRAELPSKIDVASIKVDKQSTSDDFDIPAFMRKEGNVTQAKD
ncbi:MAG TPA: cell division protein FtsZ [Candidatus Babeliales bacterium]|nr:cell division protein FtsZ [Candidatus Babeliales bacterium]